METVDDRTLKQKLKDGFSKAKTFGKEVWDDTKDFVKENKGTIAFYTMILGPGALKLGSEFLKNQRQKKESRYDECDIYDNRTGQHWYTKRPLTNRQKLNLETRYNAGESIGSILNSMNML